MDKPEVPKIQNKTYHANYSIWRGMLTRCHNPNSMAYKAYGAKGIKVCDRWRGKQGFDYFCFDMGLRPSNDHSIDRMNGTLGYSPENCRWATPIQQAYNRANIRSAEHVGVYFNKQSGLWDTHMRARGRKVLDSSYLTKEQAIEARKHSEAVWLDGYSTYEDKSIVDDSDS